MQRHSTLRPVDTLSLDEHYSETLRLWRERFMQRRKTLSHIGFDEAFARMWELYLADREAGFRSGNLNAYQWTFVNPTAPCSSTSPSSLARRLRRCLWCTPSPSPSATASAATTSST